MADFLERIADVLPDRDSSSTSGSSNYPYVTARVRSKRKFLLPEEEYPKLLARDAHELARTLQEGQYKDEIDDLAGKRSGADLVEHATRRNLAATYQDLLEWCKGDLAGLVELYLGRYDVYNLKTVLRGRFADVDDEEIRETLVAAGSMDQEVLDELVAQPTLEELVASIPDRRYRSALEAVLEEGGDGEVENLVDLENALDRTYYRDLLEAVDPSSKAERIFLDFLQREVDILNLQTLLRLRVDDIEDVDPYFVEGGDEVRLEDVRRAAAAPLEEFPGIFEGLAFHEEIEEPLQVFVEDRALDDVITALDQYLMEAARGFTVRHPLSILPIIEFILRKRAEVHNLRAIAHGKEHDLDDEIIEELLIL